MKKNCDSCNSEGAVRATGFDADERVVEWECCNCGTRHQAKNFYIHTRIEHIMWLEDYIEIFYEKQKLLGLSKQAQVYAEEFITPYKTLLHFLKNQGKKFWEPDER